MYSCSAVSSGLIGSIVCVSVIISFCGWYVWRRLIKTKSESLVAHPKISARERYASRFEGWFV